VKKEDSVMLCYVREPEGEGPILISNKRGMEAKLVKANSGIQIKAGRSRSIHSMLCSLLAREVRPASCGVLWCVWICYAAFCCDRHQCGTFLKRLK
jgi:hypothetical protein